MNTPSRTPPGNLWPAILRQTQHALACGALHPIQTSRTTIEDGGVRFLIRQVSSLERKERDARQRKTEAASSFTTNPFLPCDRNLFVADISDTHLVLLNKFNVIDHHLLVVTRRFESQENLLNVADFRALFDCITQFEGLGFYNAGTAAGASQPHKHLQIVPLPLDESAPDVPVESLLATAPVDGTVCTVPGLGFAHAFARLDAKLADRPLELACSGLDTYLHLLDATGLHAVDVNGEARQSAPYNLLVTTRWMMLVPRCAEGAEGIAVNALGFAGSLFVRNDMQMQTIRRLGPMNLLQRVAGIMAH
ncbi:ATP adenylyltransferase family protein [Burkholderia sp. WSM2232]|uniref:ATP adenylyltransferase family protein n=1 Tax=Burkholderia sp. WSM2232 TaxID=944436 RepID=UPI0004800CF2|nr:phosphorylase [Burkholderia sp. WSM2232]